MSSCVCVCWFLGELLLGNQIADAGCATLASALRGGALPALKELSLEGNPASDEAQGEVFATRPDLEEYVVSL